MKKISLLPIFAIMLSFGAAYGQETNSTGNWPDRTVLPIEKVVFR